MPGRVLAEEMRQRAASFRLDYAESLKQMVKMLFHPDADPAASTGRLKVPLRAINGDLYPTNVAAIRKIKSDFDVIVMKRMV